MKSLIIVLLTSIILIGCNNIGFGQFKPGSGLISMSGAYTIINIEDRNETINGGGFQLGYEVSNFEGNLALGGGLGYLVGVEDIDDGQFKYSTLPFWLFGKYLFGTEKAKLFLSLGLGYQFSERQISGDVFTIQDTAKSWDGGMSFGAGTGINYYFTENVCGIFSYNAQFFNNIYYKEGLAHVFNFGLGFQLN
jgi:hypothetical protein